MAEIGSAQAGEAEGSGTAVPGAGGDDGAGAELVTGAGESAAPNDGMVVEAESVELATGAGESAAPNDGVVVEAESVELATGDGAAPNDGVVVEAEAVDFSGDGVAAPDAPAVAATGFMQRAVVRRRVRFLRRRRELALHDLGGFAFESHRLGQPREDLLAQKLAAISALDDELAALQAALGQHEELAVLREPGISSCPQCSTIHDSAAHYCPNCGRPTSGKPS